MQPELDGSTDRPTEPAPPCRPLFRLQRSGGAATPAWHGDSSGSGGAETPATRKQPQAARLLRHYGRRYSPSTTGPAANLASTGAAPPATRMWKRKVHPEAVSDKYLVECPTNGGI
ncbi:hypothetical protein VPH35_012812 [Triticum aestivum]